MLGGPSKTVIALLPAIIAFIVAIVKKDFGQSDGTLWLGIIVGLLVLGGIISARFLIPSHMGIAVKVILTLTIIIAYVVTFFFTGCLAAFNLGFLN